MTMKGSVRRSAVYVFVCAITAHPAHACDVMQWDAAITDAAKVEHIDAALIRAVIQVESNACVRLAGKPTTSQSGAMGLMQLLPTTWSAYRDHLKLGNDPYNPQDNIFAGSAYLHDLIGEFGILDGLAAYFAGPRTIAARQIGTTLPSLATLRYVRDVLELVTQEVAGSAKAGPAPHAASSALLAIERPKGATAHDTSRSSGSTLFAIVGEHKTDKPGDADASGPVE
jgi:soluble lytic murein transglycosylase-like protein